MRYSESTARSSLYLSGSEDRGGCGRPGRCPAPRIRGYGTRSNSPARFLLLAFSGLGRFTRSKLGPTPIVGSPPAGPTPRAPRPLREEAAQRGAGPTGSEQEVPRPRRGRPIDPARRVWASVGPSGGLSYSSPALAGPRSDGPGRSSMRLCAGRPRPGRPRGAAGARAASVAGRAG